MSLRIVIGWLLLGGVGLPIPVVMLVGVAHLLSAMGDPTGATLLGRGALLLGIGWIVDLIALVLSLAYHAWSSEAGCRDEEHDP